MVLTIVSITINPGTPPRSKHVFGNYYFRFFASHNASPTLVLARVAICSLKDIIAEKALSLIARQSSKAYVIFIKQQELKS